MKHRHLNHEAFTLAAIYDILERGSIPDWVPLIDAIEAEPYGEVAEKTLRICTARDIYGSSKLFSNLIQNAPPKAVTARRASFWTPCGTCRPSLSPNVRRMVPVNNHGKGGTDKRFAAKAAALSIFVTDPPTSSRLVRRGKHCASDCSHS